MKTPPSRRAFLAASATAAVAGCVSSSAPDDETTTTSKTPGTTQYDPTVEDDDWEQYDPEWSAPTESPLSFDYEAETLVENLEIAWDLSFTSSDELFLTERTGTIRTFESGEVVDVVSPDDAIDAGSIKPGDERTWWVKGGEGGLLGIAAHPDYPDPPLVYAYYTYKTDDDPFNRVSWFDVSAADPSATETVVVDEIPGENIHNGGRVAFGPDGYLWITTGDAGENDDAQDPDSLGGKILRVTATGEAAPENPDGGDPRVFCLGHRNPQCVTWLPDKTPVASEHGPQGHDEVNVLSAGRNSGWPDVRKPDEYVGSDYGRPVVSTQNSTWAPTGGVFYTGDSVPGLRNRLLLGGLASQRMNVVTLTPEGDELPPASDGRRFDADWMDESYTATSHVLFENEFGRIRHVEQGPNGDLYLITSNRDGRAEKPFPVEGDDRLVRIKQV